MKHILALPTCQEIWSCEELELIDFGKFDLGHPVLIMLDFALQLNKYAYTRLLDFILSKSRIITLQCHQDSDLSTKNCKANSTTSFQHYET